MRAKELIQWTQARHDDTEKSIEALRKIKENAKPEEKESIENLIQFNLGLAQGYWNLLQVADVNNIE
jgi:hypothetical protein